MVLSDLLSAAKAYDIPAGWSGLWFIKKMTLDHDKPVFKNSYLGVLPADTYTHLFRMTDATIHLEPPGVVVMEDTPLELKKHLQFMMRASGDVLVTGLGLGCVVRGLLVNPAVKHITCIEKSKDVLQLVEPYMPKDRLTIIHADALEWTKGNRTKFDYAWHDLWTDKAAGEPHLSFWHTELIMNCIDTVRYQGAWNYPRVFKNFLRNRQIRLIA